MGLDWWRFSWKKYDSNSLTKGSRPRIIYWQEAEWKTAYHSTKFEVLFNLIVEGELKEGPSRKCDVQTMYLHSRASDYKAAGYAKWNPLFDDGFLYRVVWEVVVDRSSKLDRARMNTDQWMQPENSVHLVQAIY